MIYFAIMTRAGTLIRVMKTRETAADERLRIINNVSNLDPHDIEVKAIVDIEDVERLIALSIAKTADDLNFLRKLEEKL